MRSFVLAAPELATSGFQQSEPVTVFVGTNVGVISKVGDGTVVKVGKGVAVGVSVGVLVGIAD